MKAYIGIDAGKINTKAIVMDENKNIIYKINISNGKIIGNIKHIFKKIKENIPSEYQIYNIGVSGENRFIIGKLLGTNIIINEIECLKEYIIERKLAGNILEISSDNYKSLIVEDNKLLDYKIYKGSNTININFIYKISNLLKIDINNINLSKEVINFKNDNLMLLYEEIKLLIHKVNSNVIISSLIRKMINNLPKYNYIITSSPIFKTSIYDSIYAVAKGVSLIAIKTKSTKKYDLNIANNTIERKVETCHKCSMCCEVVSIYRNNELIDAFGNKCHEGKAIEYNKEPHYM